VAQASVLDDPERVVELSRMLSGQPDSDAARVHAAELLTTAAAERGG
jgi:DNA repair protein RecN (Recombination protein N)